MNNENQIRLQKFLADAGIASRRKAEELIIQGKVQVNGKVITELGTKVNPKKDKIIYNGKEVNVKHEYVYILLNKPIGYVTTVKDQFYKVEVGQDNYYVTDGLVFNSDFLPIMCLSWKLEKNQEYNQGIKLLSPCLHILPDVVINKSNSMERFITGKFLSTALSTYSYIGGSRMYAATTAEIGPMPFTLRAVDTPSINTTNEQLLQLADSLL